MFPFPANTPEGLVKLLELTDSQTVFASRTHQDIWTKPMALKKGLRYIEFPEIEDIICDGAVEPYRYDRTEDNLEDPVWVIQTSGTTGHPKPIVANHRWLKANSEKNFLASKYGSSDQKIALVELFIDCTFPNVLPMSWGAGLYLVATFPLCVNGMLPVMLPPATFPHPMTPQYFDQVNRLAPRGKKNGTVITPDILRQVVHIPEFLERLKRYDFVAYAGAPLDFHTGDIIAKVVPRVQSLIGSTDTGLYPLLLNDPKDWKIHRFHPNFDGFHLKHYQDDLYELWITKQPKDPRVVFEWHPDVSEFSTRDLWKAVPGRPNFYANAGRVDDFIKLASMTKFNAVAVERDIDRHANVGKSLVAGDARAKPFVLLQPSADLAALGLSEKETLDKLWPACEAANEHILPEARLTRELALLTKPNMPIKVTAKGTVTRRDTIAMYEADIQELYARAGHVGAANGVDGTNATNGVNGVHSNPLNSVG